MGLLWGIRGVQTIGHVGSGLGALDEEFGFGVSSLTLRFRVRGPDETGSLKNPAGILLNSFYSLYTLRYSLYTHI